MDDTSLTVIAFSCPNCGGEIDVVEGYTNTRCNFCGSSLLITRKIGVPRVFARPKMTSPEKILKERFKNPKIIDVSLIYIPFIKVSSEIIGCLEGYRKGFVEREPTSYTDSGMNVDTVQVTHIIGEKRVKKRIRRILEVKIDPSEFYRYGIKRVTTEGKKFEIYNDEILHKYGDVFDLPLPVNEYLDRASEMLIGEIIDDYRDFDKFEYYLRAIKKKAIIYFNPIFFSRLEVDGDFYTYSLDAVNGNALVKDKEKKKQKEEKKVLVGLNTLYAIIGVTGIVLSLISSLLARGTAFVFAFFVGFLIWWLQYGND